VRRAAILPPADRSAANKYGHAAVFTLNLGFAQGESGRHYPVAAMVANLAKPTPGVPALMRHDDVVTFFHEMGHVFHALLSRTRFLRFHGTQVARDFVEAPSQMLENWCWEPAVLKRMSSHYQTGAPLSDELIEKIVKSRYVNVGLFYLRQLFFAKFDLLIHSSRADPAADDYTALWNTLRAEVSLVQTHKQTPGQGSFGHLMGGYDAGYYGYTYSLVFAADMYRTVFKADPLDPARGQKYREAILGPGGSRDETASLEVRDVIRPVVYEMLMRTTGVPGAAGELRCVPGGDVRDGLEVVGGSRCCFPSVTSAACIIHPFASPDTVLMGNATKGK
jgi:Zn-dependent oligopeptidase